MSDSNDCYVWESMADRIASLEQQVAELTAELAHCETEGLWLEAVTVPASELLSLKGSCIKVGKYDPDTESYTCYRLPQEVDDE